MPRFSTIKNMSPGQWALFTEATLLLAFARFCLRFIPFHVYIRLLGCKIESHPNEEQIPYQRLEAIHEEVRRAARNVPWNAVCLPQAMAAKWMLKFRRIDSTIIWGVDKAEDNTVKAHAWLKVGHFIVMGGESHQGFTEISMYR